METLTVLFKDTADPLQNYPFMSGYSSILVTCSCSAASWASPIRIGNRQATDWATGEPHASKERSYSCKDVSESSCISILALVSVTSACGEA